MLRPLIVEIFVEMWGVSRSRHPSRIPIRHSCARAHTGSASASAIALRDYHPCALLTGGTIKCWGLIDYGQLGIGSTVNQLRPVDVDLGAGARACLRVGERWRAGLAAGVGCEGWNEFGRDEMECV